MRLAQLAFPPPQRLEASCRNQAARAEKFHRDLPDLAVLNQDLMIEPAHGLIG